MRFGRGKDRWRKGLALLMVAVQTGFYTPVALGAGQPVIPGYYGKDAAGLVPPSVTALPVVRNVVRNATLSQATETELVVHQSADHAVIDWESFDIGAAAHTRFDQQGHAAWSVLNRIHDQNPSRIYGSLTADGAVYLINPNGMLFSEGARINVHSLVASSLSMDENDFLSRTIAFTSQGADGLGPTAADAIVENRGAIETDVNGCVYLLSPHVVNSGSIEAPVGRIVLAAGREMSFLQEVSNDGKTLVDTVDVTSDSPTDNVVLNEAEGRISSNLGKIEMYGSCVNQQGLVRSVTAIKKDGEIILKATDRIITGEDSRTLNLISDSDEEVHDSFKFDQGRITLTAGNVIEHQGTLVSPAGKVELTAGDRIYLGDRSRIDVAGVTADQDASDSLVTATLNSVELKDEQHQKDGILRGEEIAFVREDGSAIGDVSGHLDKEFKTAAEAAVSGGQITLAAPDGDIIVREGASLDFSGGSAHHESGFVDTTWLASGGRAFSISEAPDTRSYDSILGSYEKTYARYGITERFSGLYTGGAAPVRTFIRDYHTGADAGLLTMKARTIVLDGDLDGTTLPGFYQTDIGDPEDELMRQIAAGVDQPAGGEFRIEQGTSQIVVTPDAAPLPADFDADSSLPEALVSDYATDGHAIYKTLLPSETLSQAGLSVLSLNALTAIDIEAGAEITLDSSGPALTGSEFKASARTISVDGTVNVPAGTIHMWTINNASSNEASPDYVPTDLIGPERIYVGDHAVLTTAGETVNNALARSTGEAYQSARVTGGSITLEETTLDSDGHSGEGVILREGSVLDVSGGYEIGANGDLSAGDAGMIRLMGANLILDGDLRAWSMEGQHGGTIELIAETVTVVPEDIRAPLPETFGRDDLLGDAAQGLILDDNRLDQTGAAELVLRSFFDLTVASGVALGVPHIKAAPPLSGRDAAFADSVGNFVEVSADELGKTSIILKAGQKSEEDVFSRSHPIGAPLVDGFANEVAETKVAIAENSKITSAPSGTITVKGPGVAIHGTLEAPAGTITVSSSRTDMELLLGPTARMLARGYLAPDDSVAEDDGAVAYLPLDGGSIVIESAGMLQMNEGALVDVSATDTAVRVLTDEEGRTVRRTVAANPGSVSISFFRAEDGEGQTTLAGTLRAENAGIDGVSGGDLSIRKTHTAEGLALSETMIDAFLAGGFDALSLGSDHSLTFTGPVDLDAGRVLTLDTPEIRASGEAGQRVDLSANAVHLVNSRIVANTDPRMAVTEGASLTLSSDGYLDIDGRMLVSGFESVTLRADRDILAQDRSYIQNLPPGFSSGYYGEFTVNGDLTLVASRISPTTASEFIFHSDRTLATNRGDDPHDGALYSAGGRLVVEAEDIVHGGVFSAPMGEIVLRGIDGTRTARSITLESGSVIETGGDQPVYYGTYDPDTMVWKKHPRVIDREGLAFEEQALEELPERSITITGETVRSEEGSRLDVSGGGALFTYLFQQAVEGSVDPLTATGARVLMPEAEVSSPGERVYLSGRDGVRAGYYVVVGEEYAFADGALVIRDLGPAASLSACQTTSEGYQVAVGYDSAEGQIGHGSQARLFEVRSAADVLKEGNYSYAERTVDDAGILSILAATNLLSATLNGWGAADGKGGSVSLSGTRVIVGRADLEDLTGTLVVDADSLSGSGFTDVTLGHGQSTESVRVTENSLVSVENLTLAARDLITVEAGAAIDSGHDGTGTVSLLTEDGHLAVETGASVTAGEHLTLSGASMDIDGTIGVDSGTLTLESDAIAFIAQGSENGTGPVGLTVDESLWTMISGSHSLEFLSRSDMTLDRGLALHGQRSLLLDTATLSVIDGPVGAGTETLISADSLTVRNSGSAEPGALFPVAGDPEGELTLQGRTDLTVAFAPRAAGADETGVSRTLAVSGVTKTILSAGDTLTMEGQGTLSIGDGNLDLKAPVITGGLSRVTGEDGETLYKTPDVRVALGNGALSISSIAGEGHVDSVGGNLAFSARSITHTGRIVLPAGHVSMDATGGAEQNIVLETGSLIDVSGTETAPAGAVSLGTDHGRVSVNAGATIDVSAGTDGSAGSLTIRSPEGQADLAGNLVVTGGGGSLWVDVLGTSDAAALISSMAGLDGAVYLRSRTGHLDLTSDVTARDLTLVADQGDITVRNGVTVDASGETGGGIGLFAGENLNLNSGSTLKAMATDGDGGTVNLAARRGNLTFADGATIDVGGSEAHDGGRVTFSASRAGGNEVAMALDGTIAGASAVTVEARTTEHCQTVDAAAISTLRDGTQAYMNAATAAGTCDRLLSGLTLDDPDLFHFTPGIEIKSDGDLDLTALMDLNTFSDQVGTLTLKADGDLTLTRSLVSHPTALADLVSGVTPDSWNVTLVAGADASSAHDLAVKESGADGALTVSNGAMVYSESGDIRFASRLDTVLGTGAAQTYSVKNPMNCAIATFDGDIEGKVGGTLSVTGSAIQTGTGDIDLSVGGDLRLNRQSGIRASIRTTGEAPEAIPADYVAASRHDLTFLYSNGGDIHIRTSGNIEGSPATGTWGDNAPVLRSDGTREVVWSANYGDGSLTSTGILTMAGGDVSLWADGNITAQTGAFGEGDLTVRAGGDLNGRFLVSEGRGRLFSAGNFGTLARYPDQTLELMDGTMNLYAQGRIILGSVVSPSLVDFYEANSGYLYWNPGYTETSAATVQSGLGDISFSGDSGYVDLRTGNIAGMENLLPPSLTLNAGGDLHITGTLSLFPSSDGNLCLSAGGSIDGYGKIINMADTAMAEVYETMYSRSDTAILARRNLLTGNIITNSDRLHLTDTAPIRIDAGGDIDSITLFLPKQAEITAGRDMVNLVLDGQNLNEGDRTLVKAGRDIVFGTALGAKYGSNTAIELSGPGTLAVLAGGSIDLGTSTGIVSVGNVRNTDLPSSGSDVVVISGYDDPFALTDPDRELSAFFDVLREEGKLYSDALGEDDTEVDDHVTLARDTLIATLGEDYATRPDGDIDMIRSRIATAGGGDIAVIAAGDINVGQTVIGNTSELSNGINTQAGGDIRVFSVGDMNINESRLMTWYGGDITLWADLGDINAGRGSRTEISPGSKSVAWDENGVPYEVIVPAASGSGIRALTYDPDGLEGPLAKADLGDVYLFAPTGIIDAGEAGIAGNSVYLGARTVLNVQNISFSQGAVGVPMGSESSVNLGAITGAGSLGAANQISDSASALAAVNKAFAESADNMADTFLPTWLRVEFMGFDVDDL